MDSDMIKAHHFGGGLVPKGQSGEPDDGRARTHKEVMEEVITKAKLHKSERQAEKRQNEEEMERKFAMPCAVTRWRLLKNWPFCSYSWNIPLLPFPTPPPLLPPPPPPHALPCARTQASPPLCCR